MALIVGLSTLRLSGIYFVIFSFGLAELIRQLVAWYEINIHGSVGRYIFADTTSEGIYWRLLALVVMVLAAGWLIRHSRLGLAVRVIGQDEAVARHCGIDTTRAKLVLFAVSAGFMTVTGAVMAPRWTYIDPAIAFNPVLSFEVVIMALFGGAGTLFGPLLGAVPLVLLFEVLIATFPNYFSIVLGAVFVLIVYGLPNGVIGLLQAKLLRRAAHRVAMSPIAEAVTRFVWPRAAEHDAVHAAPVLQLANVRKAFGGLVAVDDASFTLRRGEILGLIGPNGSGKTTALNVISGALRADQRHHRPCGPADRIAAGASHRAARHRADVSAGARPSRLKLPGERRRRHCFSREAGLGRRGRGARPRLAVARRPRRQDGHAGGAAHLHRSEASRACPGACSFAGRSSAR